MHLKLEELRRVAKRTIKETKNSSELREELFRVFGPPVMVSERCDLVAAAANEVLDLMEATGRSIPHGRVRTSLLIESCRDKSVDVRKLAARLLPQKLASRLLDDPASTVRCAAARRLPHALVKEAVRNHPSDDQLRVISRQKRLEEAGLPDPKASDEPFDMYGEPLDGAMRQKNPLKDMPDTWYDRLAHKLCSDYGTNLEGQWEEILATRVVASHFSTTGVKLDRDKLLKAIHGCIKDREDAVVAEGSLKSIAARLLRESYLDAGVIPIVEEDSRDPLGELLETDCSSSEFVARAEALFEVRKSIVPAGFKKYRIGEGHNFETQIPVKGKIPGGRVTSTVEKALDGYVTHWNKFQAVRGEPFRLSWAPNPMDAGSVAFHLELK